MSGHSKWSTIKRQKGLKDQKRGQTFTKLANAITISVKQGGGIGDPEQNFRLRLSIDAARAANMPKENIERAIKRAQGKEGGSLEEVMYEGFTPGGVSVIIQAATDNSARTTAEVKSIFTKNSADRADRNHSGNLKRLPINNPNERLKITASRLRFFTALFPATITAIMVTT